MTVQITRLPVANLTTDAFLPFGQVIECEGRVGHSINDASSHRFSDLAQLETDADGRLALSIFRASGQMLPLMLNRLERHPLGSQAFMPLNGQSFLIVVCLASPDQMHFNAASLKVFLSNGRQGINFNRGVWHHPLLSLSDGDFLVADRLGSGNNCDEIDISPWCVAIEL